MFNITLKVNNNNYYLLLYYIIFNYYNNYYYILKGYGKIHPDFDRESR